MAGQDDTYGSSTTTGGATTGRDNEYVSHLICHDFHSIPFLTHVPIQGLGSGRTDAQESGGYGAGDNTGSSYDDNDSSSRNKDSTTGKLLEKAGSLFKNEKLQERGAEKRRDAGSDDY